MAKLNATEKSKIIISHVAFMSAIICGFVALFLPPVGIINSSVLWFTAQLLLFVAAILGINVDFGQFGHTKKEDENEEG